MSYYDTMSLEEFINAILQGKDERLVNRCDVPAILTSLEDYDIYDISILRATLDSSLDALQVHLHSQAGAPASFLPLLKAHLPPPSPLPPALPFWEVMQDLDPKRRSMLPSRLTFSKMRKSASGLSLGSSSSWRDALESRLNMLESKLDDGLADLKKIIEKLEKQQLTQQEQLKEQKEAQKELHKELVQQKNARANDMLQQMQEKLLARTANAANAATNAATNAANNTANAVNGAASNLAADIVGVTRADPATSAATFADHGAALNSPKKSFRRRVTRATSFNPSSQATSNKRRDELQTVKPAAANSLEKIEAAAAMAPGPVMEVPARWAGAML